MKQVKLKIKKGDQVTVIAGKDKGKAGAVIGIKKVLNGRSRLLVEGVNKVKKHVKPNPQKGEPGGIQEREAYLDISNVKIFNPITQKSDRIGYRILEDGRKVRCFKSSGEMIDADKG
ncbi:MAG: 50S ribosomal protein L24 [Gammaproteobacteria bacterium GWE2_42_36]|nr:MAG: 50S ribosomal protein L24 [Gammaproteobacteria bacterium GWE2_42_36]HCU05599.1 50S ribosomal protein L24 [Coxiellaceae bacterium]